jgi:Prophage CP4-57 regulatory protein (AlpA)
MKLLDRKSLKADKGINFSKTHLWRQCRTDRFPQPIKFGSRVYWLEHEIDAWIAEHARTREFHRDKDKGPGDPDEDAEEPGPDA